MDPLSQLKDIHLPEQIHNYPIAPGWWILTVAVLFLLTWSIVKFKKQKQLNKAKKQAIEHVNNCNNSNDEIMATLKWASLQYFPREQVANLYGEQLQGFLNQYLPKKHQQQFIDSSQQAFDTQYQKLEKDKNDDSLKQAALLWLKHALPPKELTEDSAKQEQPNSSSAQQEVVND